MSLKISQINFSLIQHLQVDSYELRCHGFRFWYEGAGSRGGCTVATLGQKHLHAYIRDSFTNTPRVFMIRFAQKSHGYPVFLILESPEKRNTFPLQHLKYRKWR